MASAIQELVEGCSHFLQNIFQQGSLILHGKELQMERCQVCWEFIYTCNTGTTCSRGNCPACCSWTSSSTQSLTRRLHTIIKFQFGNLRNLTLEATVLAAPPSPLVRTMSGLVSEKGSSDPSFQTWLRFEGYIRAPSNPHIFKCWWNNMDNGWIHKKSVRQ